MERKTTEHLHFFRRLFRHYIACFKDVENEKASQDTEDLSSINSRMKQENACCESYSEGVTSRVDSDGTLDRNDSHSRREISSEGKWMNVKEEHDTGLKCDVLLSSSEYVNGTQSGNRTYLPDNKPENNTIAAKACDKGSTSLSATKDPGKVLMKHPEQSYESSCDKASRPEVAKEGFKIVDPKTFGAARSPIDEILASGRDDDHTQRNNDSEIDDESSGEHSSSTITADASVKGFDLRAENVPTNRNASKEKGRHNVTAQHTGLQLQEQIASSNNVWTDSNVLSEEFCEDRFERSRLVPEHLPDLDTSTSFHCPQPFQEMSSSTVENIAPKQPGTIRAATRYGENNMIRVKALRTERNKFPDRETSSIALEPSASSPDVHQNVILQCVNSANITHSQQQDVSLSSRHPENASSAAEHDVTVDGKGIDADTNKVLDTKTVRSQLGTSRTDLLKEPPLKIEDLESLSSPHILQYNKDALSNEKGLLQRTTQTDADMVASSGTLRLHHQARFSSGKLHYSQSNQADRLQRRVERFRHYFEALGELDPFPDEKQERQSRLVDRFRRFFEET